MFSSPVDIANRACDLCGVGNINPALGFADNKRQAALFGRIYDQLRRVELSRSIWKFAIRKAVLRPIDVNTMLLKPALWVSGTTYFVGSIVSDQAGVLWISNTPDNLGNEPSNTAMWDQYFGPLTVGLYTTATSYHAGELVYTAVGDGTFRVFMSLIDANTDNPATATAYDPTVTYFKDQIVTYLSVAYMSLLDLNLNQTPATSPAAWTSTFVGGTGSINWREIGGVDFPSGVQLSTMNIVYPLGAGPSDQSATRNAYRLPANHLRRAPKDPKAGATSYLGAPWGLGYDDANYEGNFITTTSVEPIIYRFVADVFDVTAMSDMFCEGLAHRMAIVGARPLTQDDDTLKMVAASYKEFMGDARLVNDIEVGAEEPPIDDYIACRG